MLELKAQKRSERKRLFAVAEAGILDAVAQLMEKTKQLTSKTVKWLTKVVEEQDGFFK